MAFLKVTLLSETSPPILTALGPSPSPRVERGWRTEGPAGVRSVWWHLLYSGLTPHADVTGRRT
ncbi:MAG: hypothetical protein Kow00124_21650 [Anaerolineae bacterium]